MDANQIMLSKCCDVEIRLFETGLHGWCTRCENIVIIPKWPDYMEGQKESSKETFKKEFINEPQTSLFDFL
jgi:hypothetical protein